MEIFHIPVLCCEEGDMKVNVFWRSRTGYSKVLQSVKIQISVKGARKPDQYMKNLQVGGFQGFLMDRWLRELKYCVRLDVSRKKCLS